MGMLYKKTNLYNGAAGRYIWAYPPDKFVALIKYPEGYTKSKSCYTMEEAVNFVENDYDKYKTGEYYDNDGRLVKMYKKGEVRPKRMF
jgi:hypothetical protein